MKEDRPATLPRVRRAYSDIWETPSKVFLVFTESQAAVQRQSGRTNKITPVFLMHSECRYRRRINRVGSLLAQR